MNEKNNMDQPVLSQGPVVPVDNQKDTKMGQEAKRMQDLVWQRPTDDDVRRLSLDVKIQVEKVRASTEYNPTPSVSTYTEYLDLAGLTNTRRLIDLGSAGRTSRAINNLLILEDAGIREYVGVDAFYEEDMALKMRDATERDYTGPEKENKIKVRTMREEVLVALHSMPDDYGNIYSMGMDSQTFHLPLPWIIAVLAEMKRVVPEGGIIFTDGMYLDQALGVCCPEFKEVVKMSRREDEAFLSKYKCSPDDPYYKLGKIEYEEFPELSKPGVKYSFNFPEIGFRVYFDQIDILSPMFLVNTKKVRD